MIKIVGRKGSILSTAGNLKDNVYKMNLIAFHFLVAIEIIMSNIRIVLYHGVSCSLKDQPYYNLTEFIRQTKDVFR